MEDVIWSDETRFKCFRFAKWGGKFQNMKYDTVGMLLFLLVGIEKPFRF